MRDLDRLVDVPCGRVDVGARGEIVAGEMFGACDVPLGTGIQTINGRLGIPLEP